jgi:hypothetical protein
VAAPPATVWGGLVSPAGKALWLGGEAAGLVPGVTFKTPEGKRDEVEHNFRADIFRAEVAKLSPLWFEGMTELAAPERRCLAAASIASMFPRTSRTRRHTRLKRHQVVCAPVAQQSANRLFAPVQQFSHRPGGSPSQVFAMIRTAMRFARSVGSVRRRRSRRFDHVGASAPACAYWAPWVRGAQHGSPWRRSPPRVHVRNWVGYMRWTIAPCFGAPPAFAGMTRFDRLDRIAP